jgi:hypothetical protein
MPIAGGFWVPKALVLGIRLSEAEHDALARAAEADQRSMSALGRIVLAEWLRSHGHLSVTAKATAPRRQGVRGKPAAMRLARKSA